MNMQRTESRPIQIELRLAEIWHQRGRLERAIEGYRRVLHSQPDHPWAQIYLGDLFFQQRRLVDAITTYTRALERYPNEARLHKGLANALIERDGFEAAFARYELSRCDTRDTQVEPQAVLCCAVVKNEILRLPYFLNFYREKGISRFFFVDNDSTDDTMSLLLEQPDVHVWRSPLSFNRANFGAGWFELLLRRYGVNHWWLIVDADELLSYPGWENKSIAQLCRELDCKKKKALNAVLLDMYSDLAIRDTHYHAGQNFLDVCPYFDRMFYHHQYADAGPYQNQVGFAGGARTRCFGGDNYYLSKVPLLKYDPNLILAGGQHWTNLPKAEIAAERGCLLHFKYFSTFTAYVEEQLSCQEHFGNGFQYRQYAQRLMQEPALTLYDPAQSVKFENSRQLIQFGIMLADDATSQSILNFPLTEYEIKR
jgi:tetratricopeptide (TPR) repeat protein